MATTAQRRQQKQIRFLRLLARQDRSRFHFEWNKRVQSWLEEINRRATMLRHHGRNGSEAVTIFEVLEQVEHLMAACEVENIVGAETRGLLISESTKAVARVYGPAMFRVIAPNVLVK